MNGIYMLLGARTSVDLSESLVWLIITLSIVLTIELIFFVCRLAIVLRRRKNKKKDKSKKLYAVLPLAFFSAVPKWQIMTVAILGVLVVLFAVAIACTYIKKKPDKIEKDTEAESAREEPARSVPIEKPTETQTEEEKPAVPEEETLAVSDEPELDADTEAENIEEEADDECETEQSVWADKPPVVYNGKPLPLREALLRAKAATAEVAGKNDIADRLEQTFGDEVKVNRRESKTATGLPLADTHYVIPAGGKKKACFAFVYAPADGKLLVLLKADKATADEVRSHGFEFYTSTFPRTKKNDWNAFVPAETATKEETYRVIELCASRLMGKTDAEKPIEKPDKKSEAARKEVERKKTEKVTVSEAHARLSDAAATTLVEGTGKKKSGKKFAVNIDDVCAAFNAGDTVTLDALKDKRLAPRSTKNVKILARGIMTKPLTVIADDFSVDAVKMIVLTGGRAVYR